jgi:Arc/MetJ-type ribon-helix-helix transcriptional regulator
MINLAECGRAYEDLACVASTTNAQYNNHMKTLTIRLPDDLAAQIEAEAREREVSKSAVVRERLTSAGSRRFDTMDTIADLIGSVDGLPADLSARKKKYLRATVRSRAQFRLRG